MLASLAFLALFYFYPLGSILEESFARSPAGIAGPFVEAFTSSAMRGVIWFTFWQAALSTLLTLLIGLPGAYLLARYEFRGKSLLRALTGVAFVLPALVVAAGFSALLGPQGWINLILMRALSLSEPPVNFSYTLAAILVTHVFYNVTIVLRFVGDFAPRLPATCVSLSVPAAARKRKILRPGELGLARMPLGAKGHGGGSAQVLPGRQKKKARWQAIGPKVP